MKCEDYPCCGHEPGDCPDSQGRFTCVCCGKRLSKKAMSSICNKCQRKRFSMDDRDLEYLDERQSEYDEMNCY